MSQFQIIIFLLLIISISIKCENTPSVIIIGAGAAGISAATKLFKNNITNVKVLEAENRIGGRIYSVKFGDAFVDLGAEWYHGSENNNIFDTITQLNLIELQDFSKTYYHSSGKHIDRTLVKELEAVFASIYHRPIETNEDISIGQYLEEKYLTNVNQEYADNPEKLKFAKDFLQVLVKQVLLLKGAFSLDKPSAKTDYRPANKGNGYHWKQYGFKALLDVLLEKYPNPTKELPIDIIYNKEVKKIFWDDNASVQCADGSKYIADHVILTMSLGVLKDQYVNLFEPDLPEEKLNAIEELGISAVLKVTFHFPTKWWPDDFNTIDFFWAEEDKKEFLEKEVTYSWLLDLVELFPTPHNPNVLQSWFCGENVPKIELLGDDDIINGLMLLLRKFVSKHFRNISTPDSVLRQNWYKHPHFRGTYSYQTVESRKRKVSSEVALSEPLEGKNGKKTLLFAGEATHPVYYGTVHGAVETGFREAERIINFYKNK